ncbi:nucleotidyltransferase substrate binding protein [Pasteurella oralis]|uniref:Nucleotidyltransferase substrate binding protein n=1 Tax=Pasteurella oralis TaxID=1071947 RepID=A0ABW4NVC2_9PAST
MMQQDTRWKQRFENYRKAVVYLTDEVEKYANTELDIIKKGVIHSFEITHELAWKVMQDYLKYQGLTELGGPRNITRIAFQYELIEDGDNWMEMLNSRNASVHTYDETILTKTFQMVTKTYLPLFIALEQRMHFLWKNSA